MATQPNVLGTRWTFTRRMGRAPAAAVVMAAVLVATGYLWQQGEIGRRQAALDRAVSTAETAQGQAASLQAQVGELQARVQTLQGRLTGVSHGKQQVAARLANAQRELDDATARMSALIGSALSDGRYFGEVVVVGADQAPPRLVIDLERWLTGEAAQAAEAEYGIPPDGRYDNFIENESPAWHTVEIDPNVAVSIIDPASSDPFQEYGTGLVGTSRISLGRFAKMMSLHRLYNPFWIDVSDGRIVAIHEEYTE